MNIAIVIGHGRQRELHRGIKAILEPQFDKMVAVTPRNDELRLYAEEYPIGNSDYNGYGTMDRTAFAVLLAAVIGADDDIVSLIEYDAIVWRKYWANLPSLDGTVACGMIFNEKPNNKFTAKQFTHWPVTTNGKTWFRIAEKIGGVTEGGFPDRMVGAAIERAGCKLQEVGLTTYSSNKIDAKQLPLALDAISRGALCLHGIKDLTTLKTLNDAYNAIHNTH